MQDTDVELWEKVCDELDVCDVIVLPQSPMAMLTVLWNVSSENGRGSFLLAPQLRQRELSR